MCGSLTIGTPGERREKYRANPGQLVDQSEVEHFVGGRKTVEGVKLRRLREGEKLCKCTKQLCGGRNSGGMRRRSGRKRPQRIFLKFEV